MAFLTQNDARRAACAPRRTSFFATLARLIESHRSRRALRRLDARLLDDIGRSESEAAEEARRRIWDAPSHWRAGR
ncbi:DUF1127 domain-containing protein [Thioclava pacifica]|uniref:YjiS-like domain-containing protein n=1 Tax=Thioclava pacifica DSM 10166 TaxID=1353537 RepID=A0A074K3T6_9RHOB|nr:DUF1127 domain-containing protein [Thioclava pacifica]KEO56212.1 hypothetical protein TP2_01435 [Thioclava pacifica DSM 10166]